MGPRTLVLSVMCAMVMCVCTAPTKRNSSEENSEVRKVLLEKVLGDQQKLNYVMNNLNEVVHELDANLKALFEAEESAKESAEETVNEPAMDSFYNAVHRPQRGHAETVGLDNINRSSFQLKDQEKEELREELRTLLELARENVKKDSHDWPIPFVKKQSDN